MDKNEILEKSRKENSKQDEYTQDVNKKSSLVGVISVAAVSVTLMMTEIFFEKGNGKGYLVILISVNLAIWLYKGIKLKDMHYIIISMIWLIAGVFSVVNYIMDLIG